jgi:Tfp pilus assembly PilM family ATPase
MGLGALKQLGGRLTSAFSIKLANQRAGSGTAGVKGPTPIALDFGARSLKCLQVSWEGTTPTLIAAASIETPAEPVMDPRKRLEFQLQNLPRLVREGGFKGRRVVCAIPRWMTLCKSLQVPRQDGVPLSTLVESAMAVQLQLDPAAWVHRCTEVPGAGGTSGKAEVIVMAVQRELVEKLMAGMAAAKLEPVGMHSAFAATLHAFDYMHTGTGDAQQNTLYLDIGSAGTNVIIAHGRELAFARVMDLGGDHLDDMVARQRKVDLLEARRLRALAETACTVTIKPATGDSQPGLSADMSSGPASPLGPDHVNMDEMLEGFTDEVRICLRYHAGQFPSRKIDRAVFVGGESRHRGLCQHVAKALRLPAQMADPLARLARTGKEPTVGVDLREPQPGWAVAMGLCMSPTDL